MVFIESKKYACETCIKGHRSSACKHTDRPLFEIKKKGRPVTQCEHCRELRKTKQVHVKCICELKNTADPPGLKKGGSKAPESAAFPNGLPEALAMEASVAHPLNLSFNPGCTCTSGGPCHCCTPRKSAPRPRRKTESALIVSAGGVTRPAVLSAPPALDSRKAVSPAPRAHAASHILARISELRPVLPRPAVHHDPSSGIAHGHSSSNRVYHHHHENSFFSPYGRAYDINHQRSSHPNIAITSDPADAHHWSHLTPPPTATATATATTVVPSAFDRSGGDAVAPNSIPPPPTTTPAPVTFPSPCGCGDGCSCPGCFHHNNAPFAPSPTAYPTCQNPSSCHACLDCTILSLPPDTALSIPEPQQAEVIDEWIRQIASTNSDAAATSAGGPQFTVGQWNTTGLAQQQQRECRDHKQQRASPVDMDMGSIIATQQQGYENSGMFDYTILSSMSQPPSSSEASAPNSAASYLEASLRSRSPSISPHHELFTTFNNSTYHLGDRMPASQQSMYINGRGFYSDPYLSTTNDRVGNGGATGGFDVIDTTGAFLPPQSTSTTTAATAIGATGCGLDLELEGISGDYPVGSYAVSNPDSDTSSSFDSSSMDDFGAPPPPPPPPHSQHTTSSSVSIHHHHSLQDVAVAVAGVRHPSLSVSPVSFDDVRTLY